MYSPEITISMGFQGLSMVSLLFDDRNVSSDFWNISFEKNILDTR
jgi:hypothetical protein